MEELKLEQKLEIVDELISVIAKERSKTNKGLCYVLTKLKCYDFHDTRWSSQVNIDELKTLFPEMYELISKPPKDNGYAFNNNKERLEALKELRHKLAFKELSIDTKLAIIDSIINYMNDAGLLYESHYITDIIKYIPTCKVLCGLSKYDFKVVFPELYSVITDPTIHLPNDYDFNEHNAYGFNTHTIIMLNNIKSYLISLKTKDKRLQPLSDEIKYIILNEIFNVFITNKYGAFPDYTHIINNSSLYKFLKDKNLIELDNNDLIKKELFIEYHKLLEIACMSNCPNYYNELRFDYNLRNTINILKNKLSNKYLYDRAKS